MEATPVPQAQPVENVPVTETAPVQDLESTRVVDNTARAFPFADTSSSENKYSNLKFGQNK